MRNLDKAIGKTIQCGEEWWGGTVYYEEIFKIKNKYFGKRKVYYNQYAKGEDKISKILENQEVFVPFGFSIVESTDLCNVYQSNL